MAAGKRFGIAFIKVNGALLETMKGASLDPGGKVRTPVVGANQVLGFTEELREATVECEVSLGVGMSLIELGNIADATITFECDTGQVYTVAHASTAEPAKATAGGTVPLKLFGQPAEEMGV